MSMDEATTRLSLPSGGWADFRTSVTYGARRQLRHFATNIGATASLGRGQDVSGIQIAASELVKASEADDYFPVVYMLAGWSYPQQLPTMDDLSPLDGLSWQDGDYLFEQAHKAFDDAGRVDFSPNLDEMRSSPTTPSDGSSKPSGGNGLTSDTGSQESSKSIVSSK